MSRTARLFDLMQALRRRRRPVSGAALASELGISLRTLYRDIAALKSLGAEIDGEPGLGYVLKPGFILPPLMFSEEEVEALALGLKWVERRADDELGAAAGDALAKVAAVLPRELRFRLDDSALMVGRGWEQPHTVDFKLLRRAMRDERKLDIVYSDREGRRTARTIWPFAIGFFESTRVVAAWCESRQDFRHFRVDRIETAKPLPERYPRRHYTLRKAWLESLLSKPVSGRQYPVTTFTNKTEQVMEQEIIFYTNPMSRAGIVHWMFEEVGVPYRVELLEYGKSMKAPEYLAVNPMGKVPAIRHGDVVVTEAAAICAYLADAFPDAGLAPEPHARGDYYRWLFFVAGPLEASIGLRSCDVNPTPEQEMRLGCGNHETLIDTLAAAVKGRQYIAGDKFTAADVYVGSHIGWGMEFGTIDRRSEFEAYWNGLKDRPAHRRSGELIENATAKAAWAEE